MTPSSADRLALLVRVGEALYGERWQTAAAAGLGYSRTYIRAMARGDLPVSDEVLARLSRLLEERGRTIVGLSAEVRATLP